MRPAKLSFDEAINKAGFGLYSYLLTALTGTCVISYLAISFGGMFIVPTSACELKTTRHQQGILAAGPVIGLLLGSFTWGYLADTRGRRLMLLRSISGAILFNIIASISVNWIMMLIFQFIASVFASGMYSISMTLLSESVPLPKRNVVVLLISSIHILSQGTMALLALPIIPLSFSYYLPALGIYWNSWRLLMTVFSLPSIITATCVYFIQESPKFVYAKGDEQQALQILKTIHKVNNLRSKEEFQVRGLLMGESSVALASTKPIRQQIAPLFKPPLRKYTIIMTSLYTSAQVGSFMVWLPTIADHFLRIIQTGESVHLTMCDIMNMPPAPPDPNATPCALHKTSLYTLMVIGSIQSTVNLLATSLVGFVGRRNMVMVVTSTCGVCGILVNLVPNVICSAILFIVLLQAFVATGLYTAITVSLFPTHLRTMALAFAMTVQRIALFTSIQVLNMLLVNYCVLGFCLVACLFGSSGVLTSFLPDDRKIVASNPGPVKEEEDPLEKPRQIYEG